MYFVSVTRLRVRSIWYLPGFMKANEASVKELKNTEGFVAGKELVDKGLVFWTLTVWKDEAAMKTFRNSVPHRKAMQKLPGWCNEASYAHWMQEEDIVPGWDLAYDKLIAEGRSTKVRRPSSRQQEKRYPAPKWRRTERNLQSKK